MCIWATFENGDYKTASRNDNFRYRINIIFTNKYFNKLWDNHQDELGDMFIFWEFHSIQQKASYKWKCKCHFISSASSTLSLVY